MFDSPLVNHGALARKIKPILREVQGVDIIARLKHGDNQATKKIIPYRYVPTLDE
jgi:hypothetical protein